jgi:hypothetical protein
MGRDSAPEHSKRSDLLSAILNHSLHEMLQGRMRSRPVMLLETPPIPLLVPADIFDAFGWCASTSLLWISSGSLDVATAVTTDNPPGMVFLLDAKCTFLPRELAHLHVPALIEPPERDTTWALAPYAIDDATDRLFEHRAAPTSLLKLATASLAGLFWGLHDWAHFHNHGPFEEHQRALNELQCDAAALTWIHRNLAKIRLDSAAWNGLRRDVLGIAKERLANAPARDDVDLLAIWTFVDRSAPAA